MTALKNYWWVIVIAILVGIAIWFLKPSKTVFIQPSAIPVHKFDSLKFKQQYDSLAAINKGLAIQVKKSTDDLQALKLKQKQEAVLIRELPPPEIVKQWNALTGDTAKLKPDGEVIVALDPIKIAVISFIDRDQLRARELSYIKQDSLKSLYIASQDSLAVALKLRNGQLTKEFYNNQVTDDKLNAALQTAQKQNRTKNVIIGCAAGAAAVAIIVAILR